MKKAIINAKIITPFKIINKRIVLIEGGKIIKIVAGRRSIPKGTEFIDAKGKILCPGFIDLHLHGGGGADVIDSNYKAIDTVSRVFLNYGTTAWLATVNTKVLKNGSCMHIKPIVEAMVKGVSGAQILGIHLEGPFINPVRKGGIKSKYIAKPSINKLKKIIKACSGKLKMMAIAPELKGAIPLIKELKKNKIVACIGHTDATYEQAMKGMNAGINHATHMFNAMSGMTHHDPGAAGACLGSKNVNLQVNADLVHIHPAVLKIVFKVKDTGSIALITDAVRAALMPDGVYTASGQKVIAKNGVVMGLNGKLSGSTITMNRAVKNVVSLGIPLQDSIKMATFIPARLIGSKTKGLIKKGMDADIILMDDKFNVCMTMVKGKILWKK